MKTERNPGQQPVECSLKEANNLMLLMIAYSLACEWGGYEVNDALQSALFSYAIDNLREIMRGKRLIPENTTPINKIARKLLSAEEWGGFGKCHTYLQEIKKNNSPSNVIGDRIIMLPETREVIYRPDEVALLDSYNASIRSKRLGFAKAKSFPTILKEHREHREKYEAMAQQLYEDRGIKTVKSGENEGSEEPISQVQEQENIARLVQFLLENQKIIDKYRIGNDNSNLKIGVRVHGKDRVVIQKWSNELDKLKIWRTEDIYLRPPGESLYFLLSFPPKRSLF